MSRTAPPPPHAVLEWDGEEWAAIDLARADALGPVLVADSWMTSAGRQRGRALHRSRFLSSCDTQGVARDDLATAFDRFTALVPATGEWFPRIDVRGEALVGLVRTRPSRSDEATLVTMPGDPRGAPWVKGPDILALAAAQRDAIARGASEAVVLHQGWIAEGATTSILWWRDDVLHIVDSTIPRINSTTEQLIIDRARAHDVDVVELRANPNELDGAECWVVNALHGIRPVTAWIDGPELAPPTRAQRWRSWLAHHWDAA